MVYCSKCGAEITEGERFCHQCGTPVPQPAAASERCCPKCGTTLAEGMAFCHTCGAKIQQKEPEPLKCPSCGQTLKAGEKFCNKCGHTLAAPRKATPITTNPVNQPASKRSKLIKVGAIALLAVILIGAAIALYVSNNNKVADEIRKSDDGPAHTMAPLSTLEPVSTPAPVPAAEPTPSASPVDVTSLIGTWSWTNDTTATELIISYNSQTRMPQVDELYTQELYGSQRSAALQEYAITEVGVDTFTFTFEDSYGDTGTIIARYDRNYDCIYLSCDSYGELGSTVAQMPFYKGEANFQGDDIYQKILPDSNFYIYSRAEILDRIAPWVNAGYSTAEALRLARNEFYANHGNIFRDDGLNRYYYLERGNLYGPSGYNSSSQVNQEFNSYEEANIKTIKELEKEYGG